MSRVGIIVNPNKVGAPELCSDITKWCAANSIEVSDTLGGSFQDVVHGADLLVSLGGDGTILSIVNRLGEKSIPIMGVNFGRVGFLTEIAKEDVLPEIDRFFSGKADLDRRHMLKATVKRSPREEAQQLVALNDVVVSREGLTRLLKTEVFVSGEKLTSYRGDGVILSTPTGSTAYALSAGGPIVHPGVDSLTMTPICPHASSLRSIVFPVDVKIQIKVQTDNPGEKALVTADGQERIEVNSESDIEISAGRELCVLVKSSKRTYLQNLRENFGFPDFS